MSKRGIIAGVLCLTSAVAVMTAVPTNAMQLAPLPAATQQMAPAAAIATEADVASAKIQTVGWCYDKYGTRYYCSYRRY